MEWSIFFKVLAAGYILYYLIVFLLEFTGGKSKAKEINDGSYSIEDFETEEEETVLVREAADSKKKIMAES
tara:strand:- start:406 stop:618 length:213 start_codon:yes stop_codon:yes gene_type:complete